MNIVEPFSTYHKSSDCQIWKQRLTFRFRNFSVSKLLPIFEGFGFGFGKIWSRKKVLVLVSEKVSISVSKKFGLGKSLSLGFGKFGLVKEKIQIKRTLLVMRSKNLGLGLNWDQSPEMVPNKSQFCSHVPNFILVARCQAKSHISLINSTVNYNQKTCNL